MFKIEELEIKDFKSHANSNIKFEDGINVILGRNGAGKSSILEALIVALYGSKAAKVKKEDLVKSGSKAYRISLKFNFRNNEIKISRSSDGEAVLSGDFKLEGDSKITDWVERTILPYHVFQNAIYIRQGEIESIIVDDDSREKLIRRIIRIDDYEVAWQEIGKIIEHFRQEAENFRKFALQQKTVLEQLDNKKLAMSKTAEEIETLEKKIADLKPRVEKLKKENEELEKLKNSLNEKKSKLEKLELEIAHKSEKIQKAKIESEEIQIKISELREKVAKAKEFEKDALYYKKLEVILKEAEQLPALVERITGLNEKRRALIEEIKRNEELKKRSEEITREIEEIEAKIQDTEKKLQGYEEIEAKTLRLLELKKELKDVDEEKIEEMKTEIQKAKEEEEKLKEYEAKVISKISSINTRGLQIKKAIEELKSAEGSCPTCGRELKEDLRKNLIKSYTEELKNLKEELEKAKNIESKLKEKASKLKSILSRESEVNIICKKFEEMRKIEEELKKIDVEAIKKLKNDFESLKNERNRLNGSLKEIKSSIKLEKLEKELEDLDNSIKNLSLLEGKIKELMKNEGFESLEELKKKFEELKNTFIQWIELKGYEKALEDYNNKLEALKSEIAKMDAELMDLIDKASEIKREISEISAAYDEKKHIALSQELRRAEEEFLRAEERRENLKSSLEALKKDVEYLEGQLAKLRDYERKADIIERKVIPELSRTREKFRSYKNIVIEVALGEVEKIASKIFEELTDGKYTGVVLKKVEERKEKIKLFVLYQGEEKDVNFLSGGELIALAIAFRLALTSFLVRGQVPLLILDEPTPFLDEERRRKLVEIISTYLRKIPQVIIVTHDDELKEAADKIIKVDFSGGSSRVSYVEA